MQQKRKKRASLSKVLLRLSALLLFLVASFVFFVLSGIGVFGLAVECPRANRAQDEVMAMLETKQRKTDALLNERKLCPSSIDTDNYRHASQMHVTGIGDSLMVAAVEELYTQFPNGYFDAIVGRSVDEGLQVLMRMEEDGLLGDVIVLSFSNACDLSKETCEEIMSHVQGKPVFWVKPNAIASTCPILDEISQSYPNAYVVDWQSVATSHMRDYILSDSVHPNHAGSEAYALLIDIVITQDLLGYKSSIAGIGG